MALEQGEYISDLILTNPTPVDFINEGDDHIRLTKKVVQQSFPNINAPVLSSPADLNNGIVPVGGIIMWSGLLTALPANWALCNGSNGTPDLQSRFIMASTGDSGANPTGSSGGSDTISEPVNVTSHLLTSAQSGNHTHDDVINGTAKTTNGFVGAVRGQVGQNGVVAVYQSGFSGPGSNSPYQSHTHSGSSVNGAAGSNNPLYYALAMVQRIA